MNLEQIKKLSTFTKDLHLSYSPEPGKEIELSELLDEILHEMIQMNLRLSSFKEALDWYAGTKNGQAWLAKKVLAADEGIGYSGAV